MGPQATEDNLQSALRRHMKDKAVAAREQYGPSFDDEAIRRLLDDRCFARFPVTIQYNAEALEPGGISTVRRLDDDDTARGFRLVVHSSFRRRSNVLPLIVARHLAGMNYGRIATVEDMELFGATLLGMSVEAFRRESTLLDRSLPHGAEVVEPDDH